MKIASIPEIKLTEENSIKIIKKLCSTKGLKYLTTNISPNVAQKLLSLEHNNRDRKTSKIREYSRYISTNKWQLNPDPITFDQNTNLIDGGHCLSAIIEAKKSAPFVICCGAPPSAQKIMDQINPRNVGDILKIDNFDQKILPLHSAIICSIMVESPASLKISIPRLEKAEMLKQYFTPVNDIINLFGYTRGCKYVKNSSVMAPLTRAYINYSQNPTRIKMIKRFIDIITGRVLNLTQEENAAYKLREWLLTSLGSGRTRPLKRVIYRKTEKALWSYFQKEIIESLTETKRECFPIEATENTKEYFDNQKMLVKKQKNKKIRN